MIRIRYDPTIEGKIEPNTYTGVCIERSCEHITAECEKNKPEHRAVVNTVLRPLIESMWTKNPPIFRSVGIETRAGCNASCQFCPVNSSNDSRPPGQLPIELIERISQQLHDLNFDGPIQLFGNNEPLLDDRLQQLIGMFRTACPQSEIRILTNGTTLTSEIVEILFASGLTTLTINNYTDGRRLIEPVKRLLNTAERFQAFDIRISVRQSNQILTTRANLAPNKKLVDGNKTRPAEGFCARPFVEFHMDYRGRAVGCCFDTTSTQVMGDTVTQALLDIWFGSHFEMLRKDLLAGTRHRFPACRGCDFDGFGDPTQDKTKQFKRNNLR